MTIDKAELDGILIQNSRVSVITVSTGRALATTDVFNYLRTEGTTALTVSVPSSSDTAIPVGSWVKLRRAGSGALTIVAGSGVSINLGSLETLNILSGGTTVLYKVGADTWDLEGDTSVSGG